MPTCPKCYGLGGACPMCGGSGQIDQVNEDMPEVSADPISEIRKVIPIAPDSKYVIVVNAAVTDVELQYIADALKGWWEDPEQTFFVVSDQIELMRVDEEVSIPELAWCGADECPGHEFGSGEACPGQTNRTIAPGP